LARDVVSYPHDIGTSPTILTSPTTGIKPEGYEERRRQRLFEKYGVEINPVSATSGEASD
jgi:hypothetical protein